MRMRLRRRRLLSKRFHRTRDYSNTHTHTHKSQQTCLLQPTEPNPTDSFRSVPFGSSGLCFIIAMIINKTILLMRRATRSKPLFCFACHRLVLVGCRRSRIWALRTGKEQVDGRESICRLFDCVLRIAVFGCWKSNEWDVKRAAELLLLSMELTCSSTLWRSLLAAL